GDFWRRERRLIQPAFHRERIAGYARDMVSFTQRMLNTWQNDEVRDVYQAMNHLTMRIAARTLLGIELEAEVAHLGQVIRAGQQLMVRRILSPLRYLPDGFPAPTNLRLKRVVRDLDAMLYGVIRKQRACPENFDNVISSLMQIQDEDDGSRMTDK